MSLFGRGPYNGAFAAGQALQGAAQGYTGYQQQQADLATQAQNNALGQAYTQAQIDAINLANTQKQGEIQNDADTAKYVAQSYQQPDQGGVDHAGAVLAAATMPANATADALNTVRGMRASQMAGAPNPAGGAQAANAPQTQNPNLPAPLRNNNPGALMGKDGKLQQFPSLQAGQQALDSTLASYGQKGVGTIADTVNKWAPASAGNDTQSYIKDVSQRLGIPPNQPIDLSDPKVRAAMANAISIHENGRAAVESTQQNARASQGQQQQQQTATAAQTALKTPSPADQVQARETVGVDMPTPMYQAAAQAQDRHVAQLRQVAQSAYANGNVKAGDALTARADAEETKSLDLRKKALDVQKDASEQVSKLAGSVTDQPSYNAFLEQLRNNPDLAQMTRGLNLTGNYASDRQAMDTLADRLVTKKDQVDLQIKQGHLDIDRAKEQREQAKDDRGQIDETLARQQAAEADTQRQQAAQKAGLPYTKSLAASAPPGMSQATIQKAQSQIDTRNAKYDDGLRTSAPANVQTRDTYDRMYVIASQHPEAVGTAGIAAIAAFQERGIWPAGTPIATQELYKESQQLVLQIQQSGPPGTARSMATAAEGRVIANGKPNIYQSPEAFKSFVHEGYVNRAATANKNNFMQEYRAANPDAPAESGELAYSKYVRDLGPTQVWDSKTGRYVLTTGQVPTLEGNRPNPDYVDYHRYFATGHK